MKKANPFHHINYSQSTCYRLLFKDFLEPWDGALIAIIPMLAAILGYYFA
jgi:hypothetical protein